MTQTTELITALKKALRQHGITYLNLANHLGMSEANIKNMFSNERITLSRLESICQFIDMNLTDLIHFYEESRQQITQLSLEQEKELASDLKLLIAAISVRNRLTYNEILTHYHFTEPELIQALAKLDKLKIIDFLPGNRIKLRINDNFRWLTRGPIDQFFETQIKKQFLNSGFSHENEQKLFLFGLLSANSIDKLNERISSLAKEVSVMLRQDAKLPLSKRHNVGMLMAFRQWELDVFKPLRKE